MELYLDSADLSEIKEAMELGFFTGLTTTPTFMHRHGITDIDGTIVELSKLVDVLQIEALGDTAEEVIAEAYRQEALGLDRTKTVYKIPMSLEGVKACKKLTDEGFLVNIHLVYTLQQAYLAMEAGATYVCPLVGRLQDQGNDALALVEQCVNAVEYYGYDSKIMFSSVRTVEHMRNAINVGVHTFTAPWKIVKAATLNHFTTIGTDQFTQDTHIMTAKVKDVVGAKNPHVGMGATVTDALVKMTSGGYGAVSVVDANGGAAGIFTDGDLRRLVESNGADSVNSKMGDLDLSTPKTIDAEELLYKAQAMFAETKVDSLVVVSNGKVVGLLDVQDMIK
ncbi:MAG: transaldolase family protein [Salibacteraceae bacterium]